ncbi:AI-2E family transporter [Ferrimonas sp.]|uniref:AI-2E family transporter n=1 Tax=Ferrimonas sp. TaxID=2080861 RepID=UPI003A904C5F
MWNLLRNWYQEKFSDPQAVTLALILMVGFAIIYFYGKLITPLLVAVVLAYMLEWPVAQMANRGLPRSLAVSLVLLVFVGVMMMFCLIALPQIWNQGISLARELPDMIGQAQGMVLTLPQQYPEVISEKQVQELMQNLNNQILAWGQQVLQISLGSLVDLVALAVYAILVPLLVFFFLKDKRQLLRSLSRFVPSNRELAKQVWAEMNGQIVNYIRGKAIEIMIIGVASYLTFLFMDLRYAALLGLAVGLSVLIPYIGATVVTIPVALVGLFQWGVTPQFGYLMLAYGIIQMLDGNVLVPILFSEAVNLHPVAIIIAVLIFGGLWGFWGVFFAIPLATLVKAVINAWPSSEMVQEAGQ